MRKVMLGLAMLAVVALTGCSSVPDWVVKGSGAFPGDRGKAIYGVGVASEDPNPQLQRNIARLDARAELARSEKVYVAELLKQFVQKHQDWFDMDYASSVEFYQQAAKQVTESTLYGSQVIDTWHDEDGDYMKPGTLYLLMFLPLDNEFFDAAQKRYESLIRQHQAKLLKKEANEALKELDEELKKLREDPFGLTGPLLPSIGGAEEGE